MRWILVIALVLAGQLTGQMALAEVTLKDAKKIYRQLGVRYKAQTESIDEALLPKIRPVAKEAKMQGAVKAFEGPLAGAKLHVWKYRNLGYSANLLEHDGEIKLAFFYLPIFSPTGNAPPKGYFEVATKLASAMTDGAVSAAGFEAAFKASIDEAHAYSEKRSKERYPGVIFRKGKGWNYSARAFVPDYLMLTVTRFGTCGFQYKARGWVAEHVCAKAQ